MAISISGWFEKLNKNLYISKENVEAIAYRYGRITKQLNKTFYNSDSTTARSLYVGSYGRDTDIHVSDIDMIFEMPWAKYTQYESYVGNGQSALLQEVKKSISDTYPATFIRGDGQVVVVSFADAIRFEVVPVFKFDDDSYYYPDTNNGGSWKTTNPRPEIKEVYAANARWNKNYKRLCRMARAWKDTCSVDMKGILIDTLAYHFMSSWEYKDKSYLYYDYMTRDFFAFLYETRSNYIGWSVPGSKETIYRQGVYTSKAKQAHDLALEAIADYYKEYYYTANGKWRKIYGSKFPLTDE